MNPRFVESWPHISSTITDRGRIFRWKRTPRHRDPFSHQKWGESWRCPNSAGCITVTNDGLPEKPDHLFPPSHQSNLIPRYVHVRSRQSACSRTATNVNNPGEVFAERINRCGQDGIFVRHNQLEEEFGCGIRPAVKAAPRSILGQSPSQVLGLFFTSRGNSFLRPLAAVSLRHPR